MDLKRKKYVFIVFGLSKTWHWILKENSIAFKISDFPKAWIINPLQYGNELASLRLSAYKLKESIFLSSNFFILKCEKENFEMAEIRSQINSFLPGFFKYLRWSSKQVLINEHDIMFTIELKKFSLKKVPIGESKIILRSDLIKHSLQQSHFNISYGMIKKQKEIPVFDDILLDAYEAHNNHDYRKTILYAAIALEVLLANFIEAKQKSSPYKV